MSSLTPVNPAGSLNPFGARTDKMPLEHLRRAADDLDPRAWLAQVRVDQLRCWQRRTPCLVEFYVEHLPRLRGDPAAILDLIYNEVVLREETGEKPEPEEYRRRFPELGPQLDELFTAHAASLAAFASGSSALPPTRSYVPQTPGETQSFPPTDTPGQTQTDMAPDTPGATHTAQPTDEAPAADRPVPSPAPTPSTKQTIAGYEILGELGRGGMGVVYKARQIKLKRLVALKMIRGAGSEGDRFRFQREAEAVARLQHPHIVQVYEVGDDNGQPYFSLEYIDGGSLEGQVGHVPQPAEWSATLTETLARAMHVAHKEGIVHRDLKPANVLMTKDGQPKITDFGLAKQLESDDRPTVAGAVMGTPSYMPPEQAEGDNAAVGPLADVYALGAILYELLTGRPPILGPTPWITVGLVLTVDPVPPRQLQPNVPRDLEIICLKCLAKDRNKRYASAEALADDLRRYLNHEPIQARPTPLREWLWKWARRNPGRASIPVILFFVFLAVFLGFLYYYNKSALEENQRLTRDRHEEGILTGREGKVALQEALKTKEDTPAWIRAEIQLGQAIAQLGPEPEVEELRKELTDLRDDAAQGVSWHKRRQQFLNSYHEALLHETPINIRDDSLAKMKTAAEDALKQFGISRKSAKPVPEIQERYFTEKGRTDIRAVCRILVLLLAEAEAGPRSTDTPEQRRQRLEEGVVVLRWAADTGSATRSYHLQLADYLAQLGRADEAEKARQTAPAEPVDVLDHFRLGLAQFKANRIPAAVQEFNTVLTAEPQHFWANYRLALCRVRIAEEEPELTVAEAAWTTAETHFSQCIKEKPDFAWGLVLRGHVRSEMGQVQRDLVRRIPAEKQKHLAKMTALWKSAEQDLDRAEALRDDDVRYTLLTERGLLRYRRGLHADAIAALEAARKMRPELVSAYTIQALVYEKQDKRPVAIDLLGQALARDAKQAALYRSRSALYAGEKRWPEALKDIDDALRLEEPDSEFRIAKDNLERARILKALDRPREAVAAYEIAVRPRRHYTDAWLLELAQFLYDLGGKNPDLNERWKDFEAARIALNQFAARGGKTDRDFYFTRIQIQQKQVPLLSLALSQAEAAQPRQEDLIEACRTRLSDRLESLVADEGRSIDQDPDDAAMHAQRGWDLLLLLDSPRMALTDFKKAIDLRARTNAPWANDYLGRGLCRAQLGQGPQGVNDAEAALQLGKAQEKDKNAMRFLQFNVARILAQAGRSAPDKKLDAAQGKAQLRYRERAIDHLKATLAILDKAEGARFWRDMVAGDPALASIRDHPGYRDLDKTYGGRP
jgi:tRNA A-37 threonylcarbamoyl transferase component Bud32